MVRAGFDAPPPPDPDAKGPKAREEKKSFRWIEGLRDCAQAAQRLPQTRVVCTTDREADFLDLFIERREHAPHLELLVRAKANRVLDNDTAAEGDRVVRRLFDEVRNTPARGTCTVEVGRLSARVKASKQAPKAKRVARLAETTLRYEPVALPCPGAAPVELWMVHAREECPPAKTEALEWFVLTTVPVTSAADAKRVLHWYTLRWRIEDYFRILESGCKVEELQHHSAERLERAIATSALTRARGAPRLRLRGIGVTAWHRCDWVASAAAVAPGCRESAFAPIESRMEKPTHPSLHMYRRACRPHGAFRDSDQDHPGVQTEHVPSHRLEVGVAALSLL